MKDLDAIYFAARQLPPEARPAYLAGAYGTDSALRSRVEQMLAVADEAEAFITDLPDAGAAEQQAARPLLRALKPEPADAPHEFLGQKIGHYKILERLGEGGCGVVYVAEQTEPVRRRVALKVIKLGMDTRQVVARFKAERQALAMMDHPNIAKVFEAGTTDTGRPYFVMELVRGIRITDYCDQAGLSTNERLGLFIKVCQAIQHAHQKGIIHRDIKPSNILVTLHDGVPVPKVIDFGIARATEGRLTDATVYTQLHQFIGTPAYMSPEQAEMSGLDIDTRSDIYSLGVLLYELLAGSTPFDEQELMASGVDAMRKTIREKEPLRPSTRLATLKRDDLTTTAKRRSSDVPKLIRTLKGDLDWIVMRCLEKDRVRRYETASGLANDLKRYLCHEPVVARPPAVTYRMGKAFRRNRLAFIAAFSVALALLAGTVISTWQAVEATLARKKEAQQRVAAQQAEARASAQQKRAEDQLTRAEWLLYASKLMQAQNDFEWANGALALHYLSQCPEKLRGWEWRYLSNRINARLTLTGHAQPIEGVAFSADGRRIVTGSFDKTAKVWDATTGVELLTIKGHKGDIYCVAFSPDGRRVVTGAGMGAAGISPGEAKVWDAATGQQIFDLKGHHYSVWSVAFSPDGRRIVTAAGERLYTAGEVKVWDAATGQELLTLPCHEYVECVAISPDGQRIVTGDYRAEVKVWDAATGKALLGLKGHSQMISSVAFSPDGTRIVSSGWDKTAKVWDTATGREITTFQGHANVVASAAFSPDGTRIVTGSWDKTIKIWDAQTAQEILTLKGHTEYVRAAAFSPDGRRVVTGSEDRTARVWDAEDGQEIPTLKGHASYISEGHASYISGIAFSHDGKRLVTGSGDGTVKVWDRGTRREVLSLVFKSGLTEAATVRCVAFSPDGKRIVAGGQDKTAKVWDAETGEQLLVLDHINAVLSVAFSPDGSSIVAGVGWYGEPAPRPGEVKIWDAATGQLKLVLQHPLPAWNVAFSPDGKRIVTGSAMVGEVKLWDAATGQEIFARRAHPGGVGGVAFSLDGQRIVSAGYDRIAKVWDAGTGRELFALKGHTGHLLCVAFSPDGQRIATGSEDQTVKVWETGTGQEVFSFKGCPRAVRSVAFSPDGESIVTGADEIARVFSAAAP